MIPITLSVTSLWLFPKKYCFSIGFPKNDSFMIQKMLRARMMGGAPATTISLKL